MRKEIFLPDKLLPDLKRLAFQADKSVKKLMEEIIIKYIDDNTPAGKKELPG